MGRQIGRARNVGDAESAPLVRAPLATARADGAGAAEPPIGKTVYTSTATLQVARYEA